MSARERISRVVQQWYFREPLYFAVWTAHHLKIEPRIRTIRVHHGLIEVNPGFVEALTRPQLMDVLCFEALRIVLKHPYKRRRANPELSYAASNLTVQEYLKTRLPFPRARDVFDDPKLERQFFELYYNKLAERQVHNDASSSSTLAVFAGGGADGTSSGDGEGDGGSTGGDGSDTADGETDQASDDDKVENAEDDTENDEGPPLIQYADPETTGRENAADWDSDDLTNEVIDNHIRTAQETNSWGTVAGDLRERVLASLRPKLDYRAMLRQFRASILAIRRRLTRMKPNRRYGFLYMGSRYDFTTRLLFAVDVSGSMSHDDLRQGFSVVNQLFKIGIESIDVLQFDTEIKGPAQVWRKARPEVTVRGRGGTSFDQVVDFIDKHPEYDGAIVFTDGYAEIPRPPRNRRTRLFWLFNSESSYRHMAEHLRPLGRSAFLKEDQT